MSELVIGRDAQARIASGLEPASSHDWTGRERKGVTARSALPSRMAVAFMKKPDTPVRSVWWLEREHPSTCSSSTHVIRIRIEPGIAFDYVE
jgi:hypothetical protein